MSDRHVSSRTLSMGDWPGFGGGDFIRVDIVMLVCF